MAAHTILGYGRTRTAKTSQARFVAEDVFNRTGKRTRFITTDTGSLWAPIADLVEADIVRPLLIPIDPAYNPMSAMRKLRRGEWPKARTEEGFALLKMAKDKAEWEPWEKQADSSEIGAYCFESLTTFGEGVMRDLREKNVVIGTGATPGHRTEDGEAYAANSMQHYSMAHAEILDLLNAFSVLKVEMVYVTALEGIGEDDDGSAKRPVLGPKVPGKAITEIVPSRVMDCLHLVNVTLEGGKVELRCYIRPHADAQVSRLIWPAGLRLPSVFARADQEKWKEGYFVLTPEKGIGELFQFRAEVAAKAKARIDAIKAKGATA